MTTIQIQGQLYCSNLDLKGIILTVYFGDNRPLFLENICLDNTWSSDFLPEIDFFYRRALFPELLTKRVQRGKILYLHGGWPISLHKGWLENEISETSIS